MDCQNVVYFAAKGGQGTTVTAGAFAIALCEMGANTLVVDLRGDMGAVLGIGEPEHGVPAEIRPGLRLLRITPEDLAASQLPFAETYVFDAPADQVDRLADRFDARRVLVTRNCYLALRRASSLGNCADGAVIIRESGRPLDSADVESVLGVPILSTVDVDPAIARAVDAGLLTSRLPRSMVSAMAGE